jgi:hypothetical protein
MLLHFPLEFGAHSCIIVSQKAGKTSCKHTSKEKFRAQNLITYKCGERTITFFCFRVSGNLMRTEGNFMGICNGMCEKIHFRTHYLQ